MNEQIKKLLPWSIDFKNVFQKDLEKGTFSDDDLIVLLMLIEAYSNYQEAEAECERYNRPGYEGRFESACEKLEPTIIALDMRKALFLNTLEEKYSMHKYDEGWFLDE